MSKSITISLPLPHRYLSPNHKAGTRGANLAKAREVKAYRKLARILTLKAMGVSHDMPWGKVTATAAFHYKVRRRRDEANSLGSLKAAVDGMVDAGAMVDDDHDHMRWGYTTFAIDKENPRVEVTITKHEREGE